MLAARLVRRLKKEGWSLSVAESCTGGLLASSFTDISGASEWFTQGWVTYSNESKISLLGVNPTKLEKHGAVSHAVALGMAKGAQLSSGSGVSISVTGVAGPDGGSSEKPIGTVFVSWALRSGALRTERFLFEGDRSVVRAQTVVKALVGLMRFIRDE